MNELKIVNESEYTGEETSPAIIFVNSEDGGRLVFAGEDVEYSKINNQEKSVEITEAGVTEIVPDKGYTGLSKVSVDTSAISGGLGEGSNVEYLDVTNTSDERRLILSSYAQAVKAESEDGIKGVGLPLSAMKIIIGTTLQVKAIAIEGSATVKVLSQGQETVVTLSDLLLSQDYYLDAFPRITKEQFYDLNA